MPIEYVIDHAQRRVSARAHGILTDADVFGYQREVWSRPEVSGYDEIVDMRQVERIALPSFERIRELAKLSAQMDAPSSASQFAIVAPKGFAFALAYLYASYRRLDARSRKTVGIFRTPDEATAFLEGKQCSARGGHK